MDEKNITAKWLKCLFNSFGLETLKITVEFFQYLPIDELNLAIEIFDLRIWTGNHRVYKKAINIENSQWNLSRIIPVDELNPSLHY